MKTELQENVEALLPILQAIIEGKHVEIDVNYNSEYGPVWVLWAPNRTWPVPAGEYRIKPEPKRVPLTAEDVPPGSVFRSSKPRESEDAAVWFVPLGIVARGICLLGNKVLLWHELETRYEIRRPGEDWKPCHKEAV